MSYTIAPIVEGHGEVEAVRVLLRRIRADLDIARPVRFPRTRLVQRDELQRAARIARTNIRAEGAILLILDADEDCAGELGPRLLGFLTDAGLGVPSFVVAIVREFEAWLVAGDPAQKVDDAEALGRAKQRLREIHGVYRERLISRNSPPRSTYTFCAPDPGRSTVW